MSNEDSNMVRLESLENAVGKTLWTSLNCSTVLFKFATYQFSVITNVMQYENN